MAKDKNIENAEKIIALYEKLRERALEAVKLTPYYACPVSEDCIDLVIDGENAILTWKESDCDRDSCSFLTTETKTFPAKLLVLTDSEFEQFKNHTERVESERRETERLAKAAEAQNLRDRMDEREYARLKAKFESTKFVKDE